MVAQGRATAAIAFAESCRDPWASEPEIDGLCEDILLSMSRLEEAYSRYALSANRTSTYLTWFRAVAKKNPHKPRAIVLSDLVRFTPGDEGKMVRRGKGRQALRRGGGPPNLTPCDPKTLTRRPRLRREEPGGRHRGRTRGPSVARERLRLRNHEHRRQGRLPAHADGRHQRRRFVPRCAATIGSADRQD